MPAPQSPSTCRARHEYSSTIIPAGAGHRAIAADVAAEVGIDPAVQVVARWIRARRRLVHRRGLRRPGCGHAGVGAVKIAAGPAEDRLARIRQRHNGMFRPDQLVFRDGRIFAEQSGRCAALPAFTSTSHCGAPGTLPDDLDPRSRRRPAWTPPEPKPRRRQRTRSTRRSVTLSSSTCGWCRDRPGSRTGAHRPLCDNA